MARVEATAGAVRGLDQLVDFIAAEDPGLARNQVLSVRRAFGVLAGHPLLARPAEAGRRELVLSRGRYGYIAKYRWLRVEEVVLSLAAEHQCEAGLSRSVLVVVRCAKPGNLTNADDAAMRREAGRSAECYWGGSRQIRRLEART